MQTQMNLFANDPLTGVVPNMRIGAEPVTAIQAPQPIILSPYQALGEKVSLFEINSFIRGADVYRKEKKSDWYLKQDEFWFWDRLIESGKSYLVGNLPTSKFLKTHTSSLSDWQRWAYQWALENPGEILQVETKTHYWRVYLRGEYVEFSLPHQDHGGERNYISRNGKTKVLVNVD